MSNAAALTREQLVYGLCLPLAVLLGFFLADPTQLSTVALVMIVLAVLASPLLIKWHHPLLVASWNASIAPAFLPGAPYLWMLLAVPCLILALVSRSTDPHRRILAPPALTWSLIVLLALVAVTALLTGGVGVRSLGSERFGGRGYFYIFFAIAGFFALASQGIARERAGLYMALFFVSGLTALAGNVIYWLGPRAHALFDLFPPTWAVGQAMAVERVDAVQGGARIGGFYQASVLLQCFLLARYGVRGLFDLSCPWRVCLFLATAVGILFAGYRSAIILFGLTFALVFFLEGLYRTRFMVMALVAALLLAVLAVPLLPKMPYVVQRSLAFLPVKVDGDVRVDVRESTAWRVEMWKDVLPELPKYVLLGKGYTVDPRELDISIEAAWRGWAKRWAAASLANDYHSGPLSLYIPLGGLGTLVFGWFLIVGGRVLSRNCREGDPGLRFVNRLLYGYFLTRIVFYVFIFGCFFMDLAVFVGLVGFGLSLNAPLWQRSTNPDTLEANATAGYPVLGESHPTPRIR